MPTITINKKEFIKELGKKLTDQEIEEKISMMGVSVEKVTDQEIEIEVFANRPDLLSQQGITRAAKSFLGIKTGLEKYRINKSGYELKVEPSVNMVRHYTACCVIKGLKLNDEKIKQIIQVQEKLHITFGRNRKKCAIGIYPLEKIKMPITYKALNPKEIKFIPLDSEKEMNGYEILEQHSTGKEYAHLLAGNHVYPIFVDAKNNILSMPPIINSEETGRVTIQTRDIFIECSGHELNIVMKCLNIISTAMSDLGGRIYEMKIKYGKKEIKSPNLKPEEMKIDYEYINKRTGLKLKDHQIKKLLEKMGHGTKGNSVLIPAYRADIIHQIDLAEDTAIAYGYDNLKPEIPKVATIGEEDPIETFKNKISDILIGFGLLETSSYNLTSSENQNTKMNQNNRLVTLANALNEEYNAMRISIIPNHLQILKENKHYTYPQNLFEIGKVFTYGDTETGIQETNSLAITLCNTTANFTEIKQIIDALSRALDFKYELKESTHKSFIQGRTGEIIINNKIIGRIGDIHPEILNNFEINMPVSSFEINLDVLNQIIKNKVSDREVDDFIKEIKRGIGDIKEVEGESSTSF